MKNNTVTITLLIHNIKNRSQEVLQYPQIVTENKEMVSTFKETRKE